jgi:hypothetical protein
MLFKHFTVFTCFCNFLSKIWPSVIAFFVTFCLKYGIITGQILQQDSMLRIQEKAFRGSNFNTFPRGTCPRTPYNRVQKLLRQAVYWPSPSCNNGSAPPPPCAMLLKRFWGQGLSNNMFSTLLMGEGGTHVKKITKMWRVSLFLHAIVGLLVRQTFRIIYICYSQTFSWIRPWPNSL